MGLGVSQDVCVLSQMADDSQKVVASSLDAATRNPVLRVVLGVVHVAILHVRDVEAGNVAKVAEDTEVGVAGDHSRLEYLLSNYAGKRVRCLKD